jgi:hypothetical protein
LVPLAINGAFTLYERRGRSSDRWLSPKLVRDPREAGQQNCWWLGWDGQRLSRSSDAGKLAKHHPEVLQWVIDVLRSNVIDERGQGTQEQQTVKPKSATRIREVVK